MTRLVGARFECDECGAVKYAGRETWRAAPYPDRWLSMTIGHSPVGMLRGRILDFCSYGCAAVWFQRQAAVVLSEQPNA